MAAQKVIRYITQYGGLVIVLVLIGVGVYLLEGMRPMQGSGVPQGENEVQVPRTQDSVSDKSKYPLAKEIVSPTAFLNTDPFTIQELIGKKIILVDFWTYSCINCQRTLPYLRSWYEKYSDQGLEIVGIHTPEFDFEKEQANVERAIEKYEVPYPVVMDNEYATWRAYGNRYWPRKYLIDIDGRIVYDHIGEGAYEETEEKIQELLEERSERLGTEVAFNNGSESVVQEDQRVAGSPEVYFGALRNTLLANGSEGVVGVQQFERPAIVRTNKLYLVGTWDIEKEFARAVDDTARVLFRYDAREVNIVAGADDTLDIVVSRDGEMIREAAGSDIRTVNGRSVVSVSAEDLYQLISDPEGAGEHTLELEVPPGVSLFTFTFG